MTITLATTWREHGELPRLERYLPVLSTIYDGIVVVMPSSTDRAVLERVETISDISLTRSDRIEQARGVSLEKAFERGTSHIHYCDMDRAIRWVETRPDELRQTVTFVQSHDAVMLGRTAYAWETHPATLAETEAIILDVAASLIGQRLDLTSGSKAFSREAVRVILDHGHADYGPGTDLTWPLILHRNGFVLVDYTVDGLDWETADRHRDAAADRETQQAAADAYDADASHWSMRVQLARRIVQAGLKAAAELPVRA